MKQVKRKKLQAPHSRKLTDPDHYPQPPRAGQPLSPSACIKLNSLLVLLLKSSPSSSSIGVQELLPIPPMVIWPGKGA